MTEGNGHVIDPAGEARRALQAAVAQHGTQGLSNAVIMDGICRDRLGDLPGEAILIGSAARTDVPALLRERIPREGNYGAIQSVAATLAQAHGLDAAACVWVVREYARALGIIATGGTQPAAGAGSGGSAGSGEGGVTDQGDALPAGAAEVGGGAGGGPGGPGGPWVQGGPAAGSRGPNRNVLGIGAAIALVVIYLGVAAAAHLSPFPAKTVGSTPGRGGSGTNSVGSSPAASPDPAPDPDPSPTSAYDTLLSMVPGSVQGQNNCHHADTSVGATAVAQCTSLQGLAATAIDYYLFSGSGALNNGFSSFLKSVNFPASSRSCTTSNQFAGFVPQCKDSFTSTTPSMTGSVAEYVSTQNDPIIVSTDNQQLVMGVLIGTNESDLLAYWKPLQWIQSQG